ncbi:DDE-type integrase/transposase/recombinase, partial [[Mycoplasma] falconis]|uniref:DDE-type integrase/transposase/recombinase n=1 Tax=[Mycoplasma] falconis TaxID=92403 RepID=UPI001476ABEF
KYVDLVKRDYNAKNNEIIIATDVSYISAPKDVDNNFVYFSACIDHKTKKILNWNLSTRNDIELVLEHVKNIKYDKKWIIHSDHGFQYSSKDYVDIIKQNNGLISMSRIGNSLDNREIEYFFSIIKTEHLYNLEIKRMTFVELKESIKSYIEWYNNERLQSNLNWKTPQQCWDVYSYL